MRTLIISHNSFNNKNNMGQTLCRLFNNVKKDDLAQLFFHQLTPNVDKCITWYRMTDVDAIKSIFLRKKCGKEIIPKFEEETKINQGPTMLGVNKNSFKLLTRDIIWKLSSWSNKNLYKWIENFNPEVIFLAPGYSKFIYDIAIKISTKYNISIVTYFTDDYYTDLNDSKKLLDKINNKLLNNKIEEIVNKSKDIIFISNSMKEKYLKIFKKERKSNNDSI